MSAKHYGPFTDGLPIAAVERDRRLPRGIRSPAKPVGLHLYALHSGGSDERKPHQRERFRRPAPHRRVHAVSLLLLESEDAAWFRDDLTGARLAASRLAERIGPDRHRSGEITLAMSEAASNPDQARCRRGDPAAGRTDRAARRDRIPDSGRRTGNRGRVHLDARRLLNRRHHGCRPGRDRPARRHFRSALHTRTRDRDAGTVLAAKHSAPCSAEWAT